VYPQSSFHTQLRRLFRRKSVHEPGIDRSGGQNVVITSGRPARIVVTVKSDSNQFPRLMVTPESYLALRSWIVDHGGGFHPDVRFIQGSAAFVLLPERV